MTVQTTRRAAAVLAITLALSASTATMLTGCGTNSQTSTQVETNFSNTNQAVQDENQSNSIDTLSEKQVEKTSTSISSSVEGSILDIANLFSNRDLEQTVDLSSAKEITLSSGDNIDITEEGTYVLSGTAENVTVVVNADDQSKIQLVLNGVSITNTNTPTIYVASADKVFVTTVENTDNILTVTGNLSYATDDAVDGAVFSHDDIVFNGLGTLKVSSSAHGIVGKDDVKFTGGNYEITAAGHGIQGKDSVVIASGTFSIEAGTDAIHSENADDPSKGYVYIANGTFDLKASSDAIQGNAVVQIDSGTLSISAAEGIEGTYIQINGGQFDISATDDAINATSKSNAYSVVLEINDGNICINMGAGDTDALDTNGDLIINGGTIDITAQSAFDFDGKGELNGGSVTVNGQQVTQLANSMMGGAMGGMGGNPQGGNGRMR